MGNVMAETWRLYEALEAGAIPIVERRARLDYFTGLFGPHPLPSFASWVNARRFMQHLLQSPDKMDALQDEIGAWWSNYKTGLPNGIFDVITEANGSARRPLVAGLAGSASPLVRKGWQYNELLKHHSPEAAARRLALTGERAWKKLTHVADI